MRLGLTQSLRAEQRLIQSPQMIQAMQVLQLPLIELKDQVEQELQENAPADRPRHSLISSRICPILPSPAMAPLLPASL